MDRAVGWPRPTSESGASIVGKGLLNFGVGIHDKGALLRHRLADRAPLQHHALGTACRCQLHWGTRVDHCAGVRIDLGIANVQAVAIEQIQDTVDTFGSRRQRPLGLGLELDVPDRDLAAWLGSP